MASNYDGRKVVYIHPGSGVMRSASSSASFAGFVVTSECRAPIGSEGRIVDRPKSSLLPDDLPAACVDGTVSPPDWATSSRVDVVFALHFDCTFLFFLFLFLIKF